MRMPDWKRLTTAAGILVLVARTGLALDTELDPALRPYKEATGEVAGSMKFVGSDSMNNLVALWAEGFKKHYPAVREAIEGKGSSTVPPALIEGTASFGAMSRDWQPQEIDDFKKKHGFAPTTLPVAIDMLAVFVHRDNPLKSLSLEEVDAIFSKNRKGGAKNDILTWGDLGLYGRNSASGTYLYFKENALFKGDFKDNVKQQAGSAAVVQAVGGDKFGIGYAGIGFGNANVRALPLAAKKGEPAVAPEPQAAYEGEYPLARFLWLSLGHKPGDQLDPLRREFLRYVLSADGQVDVKKDGYLPVTGQVATEALTKVGIAAP
jgi:phosphate transport system substrate-binding protein